MCAQVLAILDKVLLPGYLLTAYQAIHILPGESRQPLHYDDQESSADWVECVSA